jgi:hypothetical protein
MHKLPSNFLHIFTVAQKDETKEKGFCEIFSNLLQSVLSEY